MNGLNLSPSKILMVGDSSYDKIFANKLEFDFYKITVTEDICDLYYKLKR